MVEGEGEGEGEDVLGESCSSSDPTQSIGMDIETGTETQIVIKDRDRI